jgi:hypothetical protein
MPTTGERAFTITALKINNLKFYSIFHDTQQVKNPKKQHKTFQKRECP